MNYMELLKDWWHTKDLQTFINRRFKSDEQFVVDYYKYIMVVNGSKFYLDPMFDTIESANKDYKLSDIKPDDIVLDIGACIGGFAIPASKRCKNLYAVEPLFSEQLKQNIILNDIKNITIINEALGTGELDLKFCGRRRKINTISLSEIIKLCGGHIDFLKMDCEGGEYFIKSNELKNIRRIEMELHPNVKPDGAMQFEDVLKLAGFEYEIEHAFDNPIALAIHARRK